MNLQEKMMQEQIVFVTNISQCYNCLKLLWEQIFFVANITEGTVIRGVEGPKVLAPPLQPTPIFFFPLLWAAVYTLGEYKFFYPGFFETPPRIALIDVFMLKFWCFLNLQKWGKFEIWKSFWWNFKNHLDEKICIHLRYKPLPREKKYKQ